MDWKKIMLSLNIISKDRYVQFVAEKNGNCCDTCRKYDGQKFKENDPDKPKLPLHPNCRCTYSSISEQNSTAPSKTQLFIKNIPEATQTTLEMKYLPVGAGEIIGGIKIASIAVTDFSIWAERARNAVLTSSRIDLPQKLDLCESLRIALAKNDIRTIIIIYKNYEKKK